MLAGYAYHMLKQAFSALQAMEGMASAMHGNSAFDMGPDVDTDAAWQKA